MSPKAENWKLTPTFLLAAAAAAMAFAALVVTLSGVATASPTVIVHKGDIAPGAVTGNALAKGAVTAPKIHRGAIAASSIRKGAITSAKLGAGSVSSEQLANGSVGAAKLGSGAVTSQAIAPDAVTAPALAPGSVYGGALGPETLVSKPIADLDTVAHNGEWTASNSEAALCGQGQPLLGTGFAMTNPGNGQASFLQALPVINAETRGVIGRISTDSGGTASGEVFAICLN